MISWPRLPPNPSSRIGASISRADRDDWPPEVEGCGSFSFSSAIWSTEGPSLNNRFACRTQTGTPYTGQTATLTDVCGYTKIISLFKIMCTIIQQSPNFQVNKEKILILYSYKLRKLVSLHVASWLSEWKVETCNHLIFYSTTCINDILSLWVFWLHAMEWLTKIKN